MLSNYLTEKYLSFFRFVENLPGDDIPTLEEVTKIVPPHFLSRILFTENIQVPDIPESLQQKLETTSEAQILVDVIRKLSERLKHRGLLTNPQHMQLAGQLVLTVAKYYSDPNNLEQVISQHKNPRRRPEETDSLAPLDAEHPPLVGETPPRTREELLSYIRFGGTIVSPRDLAVILKVIRESVLTLNECDLDDLAENCRRATNPLDDMYLKKTLNLEGLTRYKMVGQETIDNLRGLAQAYLDTLIT